MTMLLLNFVFSTFKHGLYKEKGRVNPMPKFMTKHYDLNTQNPFYSKTVRTIFTSKMLRGLRFCKWKVIYLSSIPDLLLSIIFLFEKNNFTFENT